MPVETRYFRNERWPDGLFKLWPSKIQTESVYSATVPTYLAVCTIGIKVYVDGTLISGPNPVATVDYVPGDVKVERSADWDCPLTDIDGKYVKVEVWVFVGTAYETLLVTFRTEVFSGQQLDAVTWTVYYTCSYTATLFPAPRSGVDFHFDGTTNSRIENFSYSPIVVVIPKIQGDGLVWIIS